MDLTDPSEPRELKSVLTNLQSAYPKEKMQDISTSFCFICLLHLANEQGLRLEDGEPDGKAEEEEERIGRLWDVKVCSSFVVFPLSNRLQLLGLPRPRCGTCSMNMQYTIHVNL